MPSSRAASRPPLIVTLRPSISDITDFFAFDDLSTIIQWQDQGAAADATSSSFAQLLEAGVAGGQQVSLIETGCEVLAGDDGGSTDCSRACSDPATMFGDFATFYNCAALAAMSYYTSDGETGRYTLTDEAERNASVVTGSGGIAGFDRHTVLESIVECERDACTSDGLGQACSSAVVGSGVNASRPEAVFASLSSLCPVLEAEINADIFGPGVLISYVLQVCFAIILFALIKLFNLYVRITQAPAMRMARRQSSAGTEGKKRKRNGKLNRIRTFMTWSDSSALSKVSVAAATTLVDYQEAQGWFVFALQIASVLAIVVTSQEGSFWNEIVVNAAVAFHVSQNGILPMFLVQICLHVEGIRSTHTFVGFLVEYVLAVVAASQRIRFNNVFDLFREQSPIAGCGGNPSPRSYCASVRAVDGLRISFFPHPMVYKLVFLVLDSLAVAALVVDHIAWEVRKRTRARSPDSTSSLSFGLGRRLRNSSLRPRWFKFKRVFWHTLEFLYLIVNVLYVCSLTRVMTDESFDPSRWSYGQIIAMTVWGPVIVQMVSMAISGPQKNGLAADSGPPRLRIDNIINHRLDSNMEEEEGFSKGRDDVETPSTFPDNTMAGGVLDDDDDSPGSPSADGTRTDDGATELQLKRGHD